MSLVLIIIVVTVGVSLMAFQKPEIMEKSLFIPYLVKRDKQFSRFFSHGFVHADWGHLLFNMISFYYLGSALLDVSQFQGGLSYYYGSSIGAIHFLIIYFVGMLFATLIPYYRNVDNPNYRSLGASGAVSAVIFAAILWFPDMKLSLLFIPVPIPAYIFGPLYLLFEFYMDKRGGTGVAHDAHIGGALFGILYVMLINPEKGMQFINHIIA